MADHTATPNDLAVAIDTGEPILIPIYVFPTLAADPSYPLVETYEDDADISTKSAMGHRHTRRRYTKIRKIFEIDYTDIIEKDKFLLDAFWRQVRTGLPFSFFYTKDNLIGHWRFDEKSGTTAYDSSGNSNDGTLEGGMGNANWVPGVIGNALEFDGVNDRVDCGNPAPLDDLGTGDFSISFWMRSNGTILANARLFTKYVNGWNLIDIRNAGSSDDLYFQLGAGSAFGDRTIDILPFDGDWHHIVATVNRTDDLAKLYCDGKKSSVDTDLSSMSADISNSANISWGALDDGTYPFNGLLDDCRIYDAELTAAQIHDLFVFDRALSSVKFLEKPEFRHVDYNSWNVTLRFIES